MRCLCSDDFTRSTRTVCHHQNDRPSLPVYKLLLFGHRVLILHSRKESYVDFEVSFEPPVIPMHGNCWVCRTEGENAGSKEDMQR